MCQNLVPLVNIKIAGKWMFIPLKMVLIGIDPYPLNLIYWAGPLHANIDRGLVVLVGLVGLVPCAHRPHPAKESSES